GAAPNGDPRTPTATCQRCRPVLRVEGLDCRGEPSRFVADAALVDLGVPGLWDGLHTMAALRAVKPLPVAVMAGAFGGSLQSVLDAGADAILRKPFTFIEAVDVLRRVLGMSP